MLQMFSRFLTVVDKAMWVPSQPVVVLTKTRRWMDETWRRCCGLDSRDVGRRMRCRELTDTKARGESSGDEPMKQLMFAVLTA